MFETRADVAVAAGAALLDEVKPGWWADIDVDDLEIESCTHCVLGQLYGIEDHIGFNQVLEDLSISNSGSLGFDEGGSHFEGNEITYRDLDEAWRELITQRRRQEDGAPDE